MLQVVAPLSASEFHERVKESGVPMADICRRAGVAQSTPSRWKSEAWEPKTRTLRKLVDAFDAILREKTSAKQAGN